MSHVPPEIEHPVAPLELFFDLVFVFAFTQVTTLLSNNATWSGLGHSLLILTALWWAWASYAWLTNTIDPGEGFVLAVVLAAIAAMFIGAPAVPEAFGDEGVLFGVAFLIVIPMVTGIVLFAFAMKKTLAHLGDELATIEAISLCGGPALYLFAFVALRFRVSRSVSGGRFVAAIACALLIPVALVVPSIVALASVAAVWVVLHTYELIWWREARAETRAQRFPAPSYRSAAYAALRRSASPLRAAMKPCLQLG